MINLSKGSKIRIEDVQGNVAVKMQWQKAIDLDLHALITTKNLEEHHVSFRNYGKKHSAPYTVLDQDAGVGDKAGDNSETLTVHDLNKIDKIVFYAEAYGKSSINWKSFRPELLINYFGKEIKVDFDNTVPNGKYFVIATIVDLEIENINQVTNDKPKFDGAISGIASKAKKFLGKVFG